ncbi:TRL-like family protein, partial [Parabacteroides distasonis]
TQSAVSATANTLGSKKGEATATSILGLVAYGDASIQKAAKEAGITKISHVDQQSKSVLGLFSKYTVIVYGD